MLGRTMVTAQTGPEGKPVQRVYVEVADPFEKEFYLGFVLDRKEERVRVIASREGGMEIEQIAKDRPDSLITVVVEPAVGMQPFEAREIAFRLGLNIKQVQSAVQTILGSYRAFRDHDATMLEINPLVLTKDGRLVALDAKMSFDDNAMFRQRRIADMHDPRRRPARGTGGRTQPELRRPRRHHRLHRQRCRSGDGDDGHDQAFGRRAGELPGRRRRRLRRPGRDRVPGSSYRTRT